MRFTFFITVVVLVFVGCKNESVKKHIVLKETLNWNKKIKESEIDTSFFLKPDFYSYKHEVYDSIEIYKFLFTEDSIRFNGFYSVETGKNKIIDFIFKPMNTHQKENFKIFGGFIHFYSEEFFRFGYFSYNPNRINIDTKPLPCDFSENIIQRNFYYFNLEGKIIEDTSYYKTHLKNCENY